MSRPESFPFLRIARKFGVDYGDVLAIADAERQFELNESKRPHTQVVDDRLLRQIGRQQFCSLEDEICDAALVQQSIREGFVDWLTGEPKDL